MQGAAIPARITGLRAAVYFLTMGSDGIGPRRRGRVEAIAAAAVHDHFCWVYDSDDEFDRLALEFITAGLRSNRKVLCFPTQAGFARLRSILLDAVDGFEEAERAGRVSLEPAEKGYLDGGRFDADGRVHGFRALAEAAVAEGYDALAVLAENSLVLENPISREAWPAYEVRADLLIARMQLIGVCAFDARRCDAAALALLRSQHPVAGGTHVDPASFHAHATLDGGMALGGEIDFAVSPLIEQIAAGAAAERVGALDLAHLEFIDAAGMRALMRWACAANEANQRLTIRGRAMFHRLWGLLGFDASVDAEVELV